MDDSSMQPNDSGPPPQPGADEPHSPTLLSNALSMAGAALLVASLSAVVFFSLRDLFFGEASAYATLIYLPILALALLGGWIVAFGLIREKRHRQQGQPSSLIRTVSFDLRRLSSPGVFSLFLAGCATAAFLSLGAGVASVEMVEFSESSEFCGNLCHSVMGPELAVYERSAHARVECVECHVGPGTESYVRAKLNGLRQIYAIASGHIAKPIPTPIQDQRPARYTCEGCHWKADFKGENEHVRTYYRGDEGNSRVRLRMLINVGGASSNLNEDVRGSGIHYHMTLGQKIEYIARDRQRQDIPWVRVVHSNGEVTEYNDAGEPLTEEHRSELTSRVMDCMDCHNRIAHPFQNPLAAVNGALDAHLISSKLPFIKREASRALDGNYRTKEEALPAIADHLETFYQEEFPEIAKARRGELVTSVRTVQLIYERNFFPELNTSWASHPDNLGHRNSAGCFRCHNDEMESEEGESLFVDCKKCHIILAEGDNVQAVASHESGIDFWHPEDEDTLVEYTDCSDCHDGGADLYED